MHIHKVNLYIEILKEYYYLDSEENLRYKKQGYHGRYKKDDLVKQHLDNLGYLNVTIPTIRTKGNGCASVKVAHLVWILSEKILPNNMQLDHIDGNKSNNKISNLRLVNQRKNNKNRCKRSDNTSGITGICWNISHNAWCIRRTVNGKRLATYRKDLNEAKKVLEEFTKLDPEYTNRHGK